MFAMISNQAWQPNSEGNEYCIINNTGILHFLMSIYVSVDIYIISKSDSQNVMCSQYYSFKYHTNKSSVPTIKI